MNVDIKEFLLYLLSGRSLDYGQEGPGFARGIGADERSRVAQTMSARGIDKMNEKIDIIQGAYSKYSVLRN